MTVRTTPQFAKGSLIISKEGKGFDSFGIITRILITKARFLRQQYAYEITQASRGTIQQESEADLVHMICNGEIEIKKP